MIDRREAILSRLTGILETMSGLTTVKRNVGLADEDARPVAVLFDGDERPITNSRAARESTASITFEMFPEVTFRLAGRLTKNDPNPGTTLNSLRREFLKAVMADELLNNIIDQRGSIMPVGIGTDLAKGREASGEMSISLRIIYTLRHSEL